MIIPENVYLHTLILSFIAPSVLYDPSFNLLGALRWGTTPKVKPSFFPPGKSSGFRGVRDPGRFWFWVFGIQDFGGVVGV